MERILTSFPARSRGHRLACPVEEFRIQFKNVQRIAFADIRVARDTRHCRIRPELFLLGICLPFRPPFPIAPFWAPH